VSEVHGRGITASLSRKARDGALPMDNKTDRRVCLCFPSSISNNPVLERVELMTGMAKADRRTNEANLVCSASVNGFD
jgi:hypothetical protein